MKQIIQHPTYGEIVYTESFWTGKKSLTVNGVEAQPVSKKEFSIDSKKAFLKGNYLSGVTLWIDVEEIELFPKAKWYEFVLALLPLIFLLTWGNSPTLCAIFPVVGGAIGGALGGLFAIVSISVMKKAQSPVYKVGIGLGICVATVLIAYLLALAILSAIY